MVGGRLSPTASLLRNSRLFSLPPPLPIPTQAFTATTKHESDTATLPFPTHAAIETTQPGLARGDWGLKRSLPLKSTASTSTPVIRIGNVDSIDHITDFDSAADHVLTLRKFQELAISTSLTERRPIYSASARPLKPEKSVFEPEYDNTEVIDGEAKTLRWKFKGPWLASQTEGDFQEYMHKKISNQKLNFNQFLRKQLIEGKIDARPQNSNRQAENTTQEMVTISDGDIETYLRHLRRDKKRLRSLVAEFLDLPRAMPTSKTLPASAGWGVVNKERSDREQNFDEHGPPTTHPSAGLSYLRTSNHTYNHPLLGPQQCQPPVQARVLRPQTKATGYKFARALIGLAGIATEDGNVSFSKIGDASRFEPDIPGGAKVWTHPHRATIDSRGRIKLQCQRADEHTLAIYEGIVRPNVADSITEEKDRTYIRNSIKKGIERESRSSYERGESFKARSAGRAQPLDFSGDVRTHQSKFSELLIEEGQRY